MSEVLPQELNCVGCSKIPDDEILQCVTNHIFCQSCASSVHFCPKCVFQIGEIRSLEVTPVDREFYCPFKSKGCDEILPQKDIKQHLQNCQFGGEDVNVCKFLGYPCDTLINTRNSNKLLDHLHEQHNVLSNAGNVFEAELMDVSKLDHNRNATWSPVLIDSEDHQLIITAYLINNAVSFTCFSLKEISENFLVEFQLLAESNEVSDIKWIVRPCPITEAESLLQFPNLANSLDILQKYYLLNGALQFKLYIHGNHFPVKAITGDCLKLKLHKIHQAAAVNRRAFSVQTNIEENNNLEMQDKNQYSRSNGIFTAQRDLAMEKNNVEIMHSSQLSVQNQDKFVGLKRSDWFPCFVGAGLGCATTLAFMAAFKIRSK